ncbi:MAG: LysM peptidoglycan-binding domain-containing protein, partial [Anaerolineales bacterium]|nr:LysM peptidoglycan-binding domain-containing protein [Anaerolineales bacterium]
MTPSTTRRPRLLIPFLLLVLWLLSAPGSQASAPAQSGVVSRSELILAMNTLRVSNGLPALIEDPIINAVAQATAELMAYNQMSWHIGDVRGRIAAAGYGGGATVWATENFAVGNMTIDRIMQVWADPDHMRPAVTPAYCHVGAGVAQAADGRYYYVLQAAYTSTNSCGPYDPGPGLENPVANPAVPQIIIPVRKATPDAEGRIYHIVQSGQSLWAIAIAYQLTINDLEVWNNISRANDLWVGQKLFIPSNSTEGYATPTPVGMVIVATPDAEGRIIHEVQPYQALFTIATAYGVDISTILALNGWQVDWPLQIGQKLLINPGNVTPSPTPRPLTALEKLTPASDGNYYHTVASGEYLAYIAQLYEVSLNDLLAWNGLTVDS